MVDENRSGASYVQKLRLATNTTRSHVCLELDPNWNFVPNKFFISFDTDIHHMYKKIFKRMNTEGIFPGALKIDPVSFQVHDNLYKHDFSGSNAILDTIESARGILPRNIPLIVASQKNIAEPENPLNGDAIIMNAFTDNIPEKFSDSGLGVYIWHLISLPRNKTLLTYKIISSNNICEELDNIIIANSGKTMNEEYKKYLHNSIVKPLIRKETKPLYRAVTDEIIKVGEGNSNIGTMISTDSCNPLREISTILEPYKRPILVDIVMENNKSIKDIVTRIKEVASVMQPIGYDMTLVRFNLPMKYTWGNDKKLPKDFDVKIVQNMKLFNDAITEGLIDKYKEM